jgi:hypothetical protein
VSARDDRTQALRRRISAALDAPGGLDHADDALLRELAADPAANAYAREVAAIDDALRHWPAPTRSEEAWEGLAQRIEQRLAEALPEGLDFTTPPFFDDEDARRDATGRTRAGAQAALAAKQARFDLANLRDLEATQDLVVADVIEAIEAEKRKASAAARAAAPGAGREERASLPRLAAPPPTMQPLAPVALTPVREEKRRWPLVAGALSAAAVLLIGVGATLIVASRRDAGPAAAVAASAPLPAEASAVPAASASPASVTEVAGGGGAGESAVGLGPGGPPAAAAPLLAQDDPLARAASSAGARGLGIADRPLAPAASGGAGDTPLAGGSAAGHSRAASSDAIGSGTAGAGARVALARRGRGPGAGASVVGSGIASASGGAAVGGAARGGPTGGGGSPRGAAASGGSVAGGGRASGGGVSASAAPAGPLPDAPSRADVLAAMQAVQPAVSSCAVGSRGVATVRVTFSGSTGRVTGAVVEGTYAGTEQGSCIARAVRGAQVPRFTQPTFSVAFPFTLGQ